MKNSLILLTLIFSAGCASRSLNCEESCAFENMRCTGATLTNPEADVKNVTVNKSTIGMAAKRNYQCAIDETKKDDYARIRTAVIQREKPRN